MCEQFADAGCPLWSPAPLLPFPGKAAPHAHLSAFSAPTPGPLWRLACSGGDWDSATSTAMVKRCLVVTVDFSC